MEKLVQGLFTGERALYDIHNKEIIDSKFEDGESPLKECSNLRVINCIFGWKYPMWYSDDIYCFRSTLLETARSGIWYTNRITMENCIIEAPKTFRRCDGIYLKNCCIPHAQETLWNCKNIEMEHISAVGDYLGLNAENVKIDNLKLIGNYAFDGGKNIEIINSNLSSKDSFWNCENVVVKDSVIIGEYLGWNSKNLTFINCTIESHQGMCYIDGLKMINCKIINTDLCFEFCSNVEAIIDSNIDSVKNPYSGYIKARKIGELILDPKYVDKNKIKIETEE